MFVHRSRPNRLTFYSFSRFVRVEINAVDASVATAGHLLFAAPSLQTLLVLFSVFYLSSAAYGLNQFRDQPEDQINHGAINGWARSQWGWVVILANLFLAALFALQLPLVSLFPFALAILVALGYHRRIKQCSIIKTFYNAMGHTLIFWVGALAAGGSVEKGLGLYALFVCFEMISAVHKDLMDMKGDRVVGIQTLPLTLGKSTTRVLLVFLLWATSIASILLDPRLFSFVLMAPFITVAWWLNRLELARGGIILAFLGLPVGLILG